MVNLPQFDIQPENKLQELLNHPAVQAGLAPFLVALIVALLLQPVRLSGLAIIAGFAVTIYLASDFNFAPFTASRKIIWSGLTAAALAVLLDLLRLHWFGLLLPAIGGAVAVWVVQRILLQQELPVALLWGASCAAYVAVLVWGMDKLENEPRAVSAGAALGIGTGGAALVGASALLGQFGLAIGAAAAAHLLVHLIGNRALATGRVFTLPLALITGLTGCVAVLSARVPWYALAILAAIPLVARMMQLPKHSVRVQSLALSLLTFACAGGAIYLTWQTAGDVPF